MRYLLMITMFLISCDAQKNNFGYVNIDDEKSRNIVKLFEAVEDEDIGFLKEIFSKDLDQTFRGSSSCTFSPKISKAS